LWISLQEHGANILAEIVLGGSPFITETPHLLSWRSAAINSELIAMSWHGVNVETRVRHAFSSNYFVFDGPGNTRSE
jgi:hypothetical protein